MPDADASAEIAALRTEIDGLDAEIIRLVRRRTQLSRQIGATRLAAGGPKIDHEREVVVAARYQALGPHGRELAAALLRLGRGP
jgi:chorismate mutase